jgi:hypothetical protein
MPSRIKRGQTAELAPEEVASVLSSAGMRASGTQGQGASQKQGQGKSPPHARRQHGNGQRPPNQGARERYASPNEMRASAESTDDANATEEYEGIEPGNSVHGQPTHGNTPVGRFFGKSPNKSHARPQGQGGPRRGNKPSGRTPNAFTKEQGRPHGNARHGASRGSGHPNASPYVTTTLTVPGAVPQGLPGTDARARGPGRGPGQHRGNVFNAANGERRQGHGSGSPGAQRGNGPDRGPGANGPGFGKKRGRGNRKRFGPPAAAAGNPSVNPGNEAPRAEPPANVDDDIGNR